MVTGLGDAWLLLHPGEQAAVEQSLEGIPLERVDLPVLPSVETAGWDHRPLLASANLAYRSALAYLSSEGRNPGEDAVRIANGWFASTGMPHVPPIERNFAAKLGLDVCPGLRLLDGRAMHFLEVEAARAALHPARQRPHPRDSSKMYTDNRIGDANHV